MFETENCLKFASHAYVGKDNNSNVYWLLSMTRQLIVHNIYTFSIQKNSINQLILSLFYRKENWGLKIK